jgi:hypothetical protein
LVFVSGLRLGWKLSHPEAIGIAAIANHDDEVYAMPCNFIFSHIRDLSRRFSNHGWRGRRAKEEFGIFRPMLCSSSMFYGITDT